MLRQVLEARPVPGDERVLAGFVHAKDAAVFLLDEDRAVLATLDVAAGFPHASRVGSVREGIGIEIVSPRRI